MADEKKGVSVKEIENFTKKHRLEVFFVLQFILATLFSWVFFGTGWSILLAGAGAILGVLMPGKIEFATKKMYQFFFKQENTTQIILAVVGLIIAIFLPFIVFLKIGAQGGKSLYHLAMEIYSQNKKE